MAKRAAQTAHIKKAGRPHKKKDLLHALAQCLGVISVACETAGVGRRTFYNWYEKDVAFAKEYDDINNRALDFVESKLLANIENGDVASIIFYLKTKGKSRGYVERSEINATIQTEVKRFNLIVKEDDD